ncbi:hypothetical protein [Yinghuangia sp. YIM S09857]|uniref:hypothetical protein n=1 Tax=Yinghuangia sp. YIM S09857 TaxID=3436929 RepID=UPI003F53759B
MNATASALVRQGKGPVAVIVGQIRESLSNTERMRDADDELLRHQQAAEQLRQDDDLVRQTAAELADAHSALKIVPLVSGYRLAERALTQGRTEERRSPSKFRRLCRFRVGIPPLRVTVSFGPDGPPHPRGGRGARQRRAQ